MRGPCVRVKSPDAEFVEEVKNMDVIAENKLDTERCCVGFVGVGLTLVAFCERCKEWNGIGTE